MEVGLKQNNKRAEKLIVDFFAHNKTNSVRMIHFIEQDKAKTFSSLI
jgi:hypothetical protein